MSTDTPQAHPTHHLDIAAIGALSTEERLAREWLVTNGLGGYASGTVVGALTRRFHALLVAALPAPHGRVAMLSHLAEGLAIEDAHPAWLGPYGSEARLTAQEGSAHLEAFLLQQGLPVWHFAVAGCRVERLVYMPYGQNTVQVRYRLLEGPKSVGLTLRPMLAFRPHERAVDSVPLDGYRLVSEDKRLEVHHRGELPPLHFALHADSASFTIDNEGIRDVHYLLEEHRGYDHQGHLWSPGHFTVELVSGADVTLIASVEAWDVLARDEPSDALAAERTRRCRLLDACPDVTHDPAAAELVLAADQFIISPATRMPRHPDGRQAEHDGPRRDDENAASAVRSVIAGYHWFTDWGRDTMIALEGLTLVTGRHDEARAILLEFARHVRDGLVPNLFPEGASEGLYHTADATLWFFHALRRYEHWTGDAATVDRLLPVLIDILAHHEAGTRFGIRVEEDGLLTQGAPGYQLTWMDAKVDGWVVTPRRGKAVEINALWYNALATLHHWLEERGDDRASGLPERMAATHRAFNDRFWNPDTGHLFDVVDGEGGNDPACRPNQVFALSLDHPVLDERRWPQVLDAVTSHLLTPAGLRSLAPDHPDYKPQYFGDLRARDAAYHQGTVWGWLIGPYVDAWLRMHPEDRAGARRVLLPLVDHLDDGCVGSVSEVFDADHAAGLHRAGLERRRVAARLGALERAAQDIARHAAALVVAAGLVRPRGP
jgi:glycogen debranching enzyme